MQLMPATPALESLRQKFSLQKIYTRGKRNTVLWGALSIQQIDREIWFSAAVGYDASLIF